MSFDCNRHNDISMIMRAICQMCSAISRINCTILVTDKIEVISSWEIGKFIKNLCFYVSSRKNKDYNGSYAKGGGILQPATLKWLTDDFQHFGGKLNVFLNIYYYYFFENISFIIPNFHAALFITPLEKSPVIHYRQSFCNSNIIFVSLSYKVISLQEGPRYAAWLHIKNDTLKW